MTKKRLSFIYKKLPETTAKGQTSKLKNKEENIF